MANAYNISLVLVRTLGLLLVAVGTMGIAFVVTTVLFFATGVARWLVEPALSYAAQGAFSSPIWLLGGIFIMWRSIPIARFIAKHCDV